jgi:integrase
MGTVPDLFFCKPPKRIDAMPKRIAPLTDRQVKSAKPQAKDTKLYDGNGLFLLVTKTGGKLWHFKYRFEGKEKKLTFGSYPQVSLVDARSQREKARIQVAKGVDPGIIKKAIRDAVFAKGENSFEVVAQEWHSKFSKSWSSSHAETTIRRLKLHVFPFIGSKPIQEINASDVLSVLNRIEDRKALETAHRVRTLCGQVLRYAVGTSRADRDITVDLKGVLPPYKKGHHAAVIDPVKLAPILRAIDDYEGSFIVKCALKLVPLIFVRPGELRHAEWCNIDFMNMQWDIPAEQMKMKIPHVVPLSHQSITILKELQQLTGHEKYLFPCNRHYSRPMSNCTINAALRRMGFDKDTVTCHGFRATARTILDEVLDVRPDFIEHQLSHTVRDSNGRAYNRTSHLLARKEMMQTWADYLDEIKIKM